MNAFLILLIADTKFTIRENVIFKKILINSDTAVRTKSEVKDLEVLRSIKYLLGQNILPIFGNKLKLEVCGRYRKTLGVSVTHVTSLFVESLKRVTSYIPHIFGALLKNPHAGRN